MTIYFPSHPSPYASPFSNLFPSFPPLSKDGKAVASTPWNGAVGILLDDVYESRPQGTILKRAYINTGRAQTNSGKTYDAALVAALINAGCNIIFEEPAVVGTIPSAASE